MQKLAPAAGAPQNEQPPPPPSQALSQSVVITHARGPLVTTPPEKKGAAQPEATKTQKTNPKKKVNSKPTPNAAPLSASHSTQHTTNCTTGAKRTCRCECGRFSFAAIGTVVQSCRVVTWVRGVGRGARVRVRVRVRAVGWECTRLGGKEFERVLACVCRASRV